MTDCINRAKLDDVWLDDGLHEATGLATTTHADHLESRDPTVEHPCLALKKLLGAGSFYYSLDFDLTNRMQDRFVTSSSDPMGS